MPTLREALELARRTIRPDARERPKRSAGQVLQVDPGLQPDAWHLLGMIAHQSGQHALAVDCICRRSRSGRRRPAIAESGRPPIRLSGSWMRPWPATARHCSSSRNSPRHTTIWGTQSGGKETSTWRQAVTAIPCF